ncbi:MAG: tetracycline resistance efflux pump [Campylobacterota bacterium]|nr:tetracycline resistance efflux pump [Campylobacterota bacterium]
MALYTKNVFAALGSGIFLAYFILNNFAFFDSFVAIYNLFYSLLSEAWVLKTLAFALMAGSIITLIEKSGGVEGFVEHMQHKTSLVNSPRSALMVSYLIGVFIFVESSITSLIAGAVGRPFCHRYKIPSAKLAFVCDSTSAPVSSIIAINGWGALLLGLITTQVTLGVINVDSVEILIKAILYNFYSIIALVVTFLFIWFSIDIGAMKNAKYVANDALIITKRVAPPSYMLYPIALMVFFVFLFLYISGGGDILKGSGSSAIFYTMIATLAFTLFYYLLTKNMTLKLWGKSAMEGAIRFMPITLILLFAFAIGQSTTELKTGYYLASLLGENLSPYMLAAVIFLMGAVISFATGTSWGTFSIMIPIAVPMAVAMDANIALCIGAVISGGVFGDHCSPISDTTIISAMASDCEIVEHVNTQLPYALISGSIAFILFVVFGIVLN